MLNCFSSEGKHAIPIRFVTKDSYTTWLEQQASQVQNWLAAIQFKLEPANAAMVPKENGHIDFVVCCLKNADDHWSVGNLPMLLPAGLYHFETDEADETAKALIWGLGAYQFTRYKTPKKEFAKLYLPKTNRPHLQSVIEATYLVRDLINTPADDLGPSEFAQAARQFAQQFSTEYAEIVGEDLLQQNYPAIYTVGRASDDAPRLLDLRWGEASHPKITLVGKGVCFDSGGLDIKPSSAMLLMKKDMGGAAHVLGLAQMIIAAKLPVRLRVLIPLAENVISGNAYRPGDVIKTRQGKTVEIGNTDAEGRLVLADALTEAVSENPALLIDISTLTGAARVALGTELPAVFSNNQSLVDAVIKAGEIQQDLMWQLPLFAPYREYLISSIADLNNCPSDPYGGAITAALFLQDFVPDQIPWLHFDMMAWNLRPRPGKPVGGEAMCLRALFQYLHEKFKRNG